jgi:uncharacterized protein
MTSDVPAMHSGLRRLPMFPLGTVLFPYGALPLHIFEPRYRQLTADCLAGDREFGVVLISRGSEVGGGDERVMTGTIARIEMATPFPDGRFALMAEGTRRLRVEQWLEDEPYPLALVRELPASPSSGTSDLVDAALQAIRRARALYSELGAAPALIGDVHLGESADEASWRLASLAPLNPYDSQRLLEIDEPGARLERLIELAEEISGDLERLLSEPRPDLEP